MPNQSDTSAVPPALQQIANTFRLTGWIGFWTQLVLGAISAFILLFAVLSRTQAEQTQFGTGVGILFASAGLLALAFNIYWSFRFTRIARQLQAPKANLRPSKADTIKTLRLGLVVNLAGMLLSIIGAEALVGTLIGRSLAQPQTVFIDREIIRAIDIFVVQANTNTIAAHFAGLAATLWLLHRISRQ